MSYAKGRIEVSGTYDGESHWLNVQGHGGIADMVAPHSKENARRLAACWNACLGFEDPEADIRALREVAEAAEHFLACHSASDTRTPYLTEHGRGGCDSPYGELHAALDRWRGET